MGDILLTIDGISTIGKGDFIKALIASLKEKYGVAASQTTEPLIEFMLLRNDPVFETDDLKRRPATKTQRRPSSAVNMLPAVSNIFPLPVGLPTALSGIKVS